MNSLTLVINKNPFRLQEREIRTLAVNPRKTLRGYLRSLYREYPELGRRDTEIIASVNGKIINRRDFGKIKPATGDYIAICPVIAGGGRGRKIFATVVSIAVMMTAAGVGKALAEGGKWTLNSVLAASAVNQIGGMLVNRLMPQPKFDGFADTPVTQSYSWGSLQPLQGQGNPIPITYGTVRTAGQLLAQHITNDGSNQYLNLLLCGGEGPVDVISDILIADNPHTNYKGVQIDTRLGTNDQTHIPNFNDTYAEQSLSFQLTGSNWCKQITEGDSGQGLEVVLECPRGLYHVKDDGNFDEAGVTVQLQYRPENGAWSNWGTYTIAAATSAPVRRTFRLDYLPAARYEVQAICLSKSGASNRYSTDVYWTQLSHIIYDDFARPGRVLLGIRALATDQLSGGVPSISWLQQRLKVWVWNPVHNIYEERPANNPAWAAYDLVHRCRLLRNINTGDREFLIGGVAAARMDYQAFNDWAEYCANKHLEVNIIIEQTSDLWGALKDIEAAGRGKVLLRGTKYSAICDAPVIPVQLFTVANIKQDSFNEEFLSIKDRANAIEVAFINKDKNYQKDTFMVYSEDWDRENVIKNPTQISLTGVTSYEQAWKEAKYRLRLNKYLLRTVSFETDVDAIACQVGDVILVQHDVPQWGSGGRIVAAAANTVTLDTTVALEAEKTYSITIRLADDTLVQKQIAAVAEYTETDVLTVDEPFFALPRQYDVYSFGELLKSSKPFRVVAISRLDDMTCRISALEYNEALYAEADIVPVIDYSEKAAGPVKVEAYEEMDADGNKLLTVTWLPPRVRFNGFRVEIDDKIAGVFNITCTKATTRIEPDKTYRIKVTVLGEFGDLGHREITYAAGGQPLDIQNYVVLQNLRQLEHHWTGNSNNAGVEIRRLDPNNPSWDAGAAIVSGAAGTKFIDSAIVPGALIYGIKAIGRNGQYSQTMKLASVTVGNIPSSNLVVALDEFEELNGSFSNCYADTGKVLLNPQEVWEEAAGQDIWNEAAEDLWGLPVVAAAIYTTAIKDVGRMMYSLLKLQTISYTSAYEIEWRYAETDPRGPDGNWDETLATAQWKKFIDGGGAKFRYHQWRLSLKSDGAAQCLSAFQVIIDVPDQIIKYPNEFLPFVTISDANAGVRLDFPAGTYCKPPTVTGSVVPGPGYIIPATVTKDYAVIKATTNGTDRITGDLNVQFIGY